MSLSLSLSLSLQENLCTFPSLSSRAFLCPTECNDVLLFGSLAKSPGPMRMACGNWDATMAPWRCDMFLNAAHILEQECFPTMYATLLLGDVLRQTQLALRHVISRSALRALAIVSVPLWRPPTSIINNCCVIALPVGMAAALPLVDRNVGATIAW